MNLTRITLTLAFLLASLFPLSAQTDREKKMQAMEILTDDSYFSLQKEGEWGREGFSLQNLTTKGKKDLVESQINPERKRAGLRTYKWERWDPVIRTLTYRSKAFDYVVVYISESDLLSFGSDPASASASPSLLSETSASGSSLPSDASAGASTPVPSGSSVGAGASVGSSAPASADSSVPAGSAPASAGSSVAAGSAPASAGSSVAAGSVPGAALPGAVGASLPDTVFASLPPGVRLDIPAGAREVAEELIDKPGFPFGQAAGMLYDLADENVINGFEPVGEGAELPVRCLLIEIDGDYNVARLIGYGADGDYYDLRTGTRVNRHDLAGRNLIYVN